MKKISFFAFLAIALLMTTSAWAHVGSPDVFFEGAAGPYKLFVTIRMPDVIPGVAQVEIRSQSPGVSAIHVQPLRLTGAGSQFAPIAEALQQSPVITNSLPGISGLWSSIRFSCTWKRAATAA